MNLNLLNSNIPPNSSSLFNRFSQITASYGLRSVPVTAIEIRRDAVMRNARYASTLTLTSAKPNGLVRDTDPIRIYHISVSNYLVSGKEQTSHLALSKKNITSRVSHAICAIKINNILYCFNSWGYESPPEYKMVDKMIFNFVNEKFAGASKILIYDGPTVQSSSPGAACNVDVLSKNGKFRIKSGFCGIICYDFLLKMLTLGLAGIIPKNQKNFNSQLRNLRNYSIMFGGPNRSTAANKNQRQAGYTPLARLSGFVNWMTGGKKHLQPGVNRSKVISNSRPKYYLYNKRTHAKLTNRPVNRNTIINRVKNLIRSNASLNLNIRRSNNVFKVTNIHAHRRSGNDSNGRKQANIKINFARIGQENNYDETYRYRI